MSNHLREQNLKRNADFLVQIGIGNADTNIRGNDNCKRKKTKQTANDDNIPARKSARIQGMQERDEEYKCEKCNNGKSYHSLKGLRIHQKQNCTAAENYKPSSYYCLTNEEIHRMLHCQENPYAVKDGDTVGIQKNQMATIEQNIFEKPDVVFENKNEELSMLEDVTEYKDSLPFGEIDKEDEPISSFAISQQKLCSYIFGEEFLSSSSFEDMIIAVQSHYQKLGKNRSRLNQSISETCLHRFSLEAGLSRANCMKLLSVIRSFDPQIPVPKTVHGIETRMRKSVKEFNNCVEIRIPWIQSWRMNELKGFPPVKVYLRNIFEVISHMLIDPDIMFKWRRHVKFSYFRAKDRNDNHVYSDVMTSEWALDTERLVKSKNVKGFLMPLIFYTDGVQVGSSVHNKITPVIVTLGNFSDQLIQKDFVKRVIAYLPNFRCYSKDIIISHLMSKLSIKKTKVTIPMIPFIFIYI